jgi:hypothetical protein
MRVLAGTLCRSARCCASILRTGSFGAENVWSSSQTTVSIQKSCRIRNVFGRPKGPNAPSGACPSKEPCQTVLVLALAARSGRDFQIRRSATQAPRGRGTAASCPVRARATGRSSTPGEVGPAESQPEEPP